VSDPRRPLSSTAYALELPNKIGLSQTHYLIVQQLYAGWSRLAYLLVIELVSMITVAVLSRAEPRVFWPVIAAIVFLLAAQVLFWMFTYPANAATRNWTIVPENWFALRTR
jgi:hypothetical protein